MQFLDLLESYTEDMLKSYESPQKRGEELQIDLVTAFIPFAIQNWGRAQETTLITSSRAGDPYPETAPPEVVASLLYIDPPVLEDSIEYRW